MSTQMDFEKLFTPVEANKRLPLVKHIVEDLLRHGQDLKMIVDNPKDESQDRLRMESLKKRILVNMKELEDLGCFYKDWNFEIGLVDFPAEIDGQPVFLCWRSDEADIRWYHPVEDGYAARKPIPESLLIS